MLLCLKVSTIDEVVSFCNVVIRRSSVLFPCHQARNTRVKKRGVISSAWLEKYKPELPKDLHHDSILQSGNLVENESEPETVHADEHNSAEKRLNNENNTLPATRQSGSSCLSVEEAGYDKENSLCNASITEDTIKTTKTLEVELFSGKQECTKEECLKSKDTVSKSKERERNFDKGSLTDNLHLNITDSHPTSNKRCASTSETFVVTKPVVSNESKQGADPESSDSLQEIAAAKRKAEERTIELEKPCKKLRIESDDEEAICNESKVYM